MLLARTAAAGVVPDVPGRAHVADLVRDGETGYVADWRDNDRFVECIDRLLSDNALRRQMGKAAREEAARRFSKDRVAAETMKVYEELLGGKA